jgi:hypothetical protein
MPGKKMAVVLSGLHYQENYLHFSGEAVKIDFEMYTKNIKKKIYEHFSNSYKIDTFICTNQSSKVSDLLRTYKLVRYAFEAGDAFQKRVKALQLLVDYIKTSKTRYELVLLTRFDIYFMRQFTRENLDLRKFNMVSVLEQKHLCDDNLFVFPIQYLLLFHKLLQHRLTFPYNTLAMHNMKEAFEKNMEVNYICNEPGLVRQLSFFKLRYFEDIELVLNRHLFTERVAYYSKEKSCSIVIDNNIVHFNKHSEKVCEDTWFGYDLLQSRSYLLRFQVHSSVDLSDFDFLHFQKSKQVVKVSSTVKAAQWETVEVKIDVGEDPLLAFNFENFPGLMNVVFRDVNFFINPV